MILVAACVGLLVYALYTLQKGTGNREDLMGIIPSDVHTLVRIHPGKDDNDGNVLLTLIAGPERQNTHKIINDIAVAGAHLEMWKACADVAHTLVIFNDKNCSNPLVIVPLKRETTAADLITAFGNEYTKRDFENTTIAQCESSFSVVIAGHLILSNASSALEKLIIDFNLNKTLSGKEFQFVEEFLKGDKDIVIKLNNTEWWNAELGTSDDGLRTLFGEIQSDSISEFYFPKTKLPLGKYELKLPRNISSAELLPTGDYGKTWSELNTYFADFHPKASVSWMNAWSETADTAFTLLEWRKSLQGTFTWSNNDGSDSKISCIGGEDSVLISQRLASLISKPLAEYPGVNKMSNHTLLERNFPDGADGNYFTEKNHVLYFGGSPTDLYALLKDSSELDAGIYQSWDEACDEAFAWYYWSNGKAPNRLKDLNRYHFAMNCTSAHLRIEDERPYLKVFLHDHILSEAKEEAVASDKNACFDVTNHTDGSSEKLCFQETTLERFDQQSVSLFKVNIDGNALGRVWDVDGLQNGKLQAAFTTHKKLYVIDRKGNALAGFPISSAHSISSGLLVADYNGDKKYRLIFGTSDGNVMNYDIAGNPVPGWQFAAVQPCVTAIHHIRCEGEDHLITIQQDGQIQVLKRNGESRNLRCNNAPSYDGRGCEVVLKGNLLSTAELHYTSSKGEAQTVKLLLEN